MNILDFKAKWAGVTLTERSAAHQHFLDLCEALGVPKPAALDPRGDYYTFEKGVSKLGGGRGFADVWYRDHFAWEYKGLHANLAAAYAQLKLYAEDLENPPLLVVCDLDRFEVHTQFNNMAKEVYSFDLETIDLPDNLRVLRALWLDPQSLRPRRTTAEVSELAAEQFGKLALDLGRRGIAPERAAHFLVQVLFCLFAEDVGLLPKGLFGQLLDYGRRYPQEFPRQIEQLFTAMRDGGSAGFQRIDHFNGGLFAQIDVVPLEQPELDVLWAATQLDWTSIEPAIIGTLFERSLDPARRSQLGAHYTDKADIARVVEPVVMWPLRRRWEAVKAQAEPIVVRARDAPTPTTRRNRLDELNRLLGAFLDELKAVTVLDPACGSGNFLYVALNELLSLEKEVISYGAAAGLSLMLPQVSPEQLYGLEINRYAQELTQVVVWIGYLQWMTANGFQPRRDPVLGAMDNIRLQDALLDRSDPEHPKEAAWPAADYIIGNPPFLGAKKLRSELGDPYVMNLFEVYGNRIPGMSDLACYFFERAREEIEHGTADRAGLLATNSIRGGGSRAVLDRIRQSGDIYMAWEDEPWILDGAAVRISIVGFDDGAELRRELDGVPVQTITSALKAGVDLRQAQRLPENRDTAFIGDVKGGAFDVDGSLAGDWLLLPMNPNGRPNSDVVRPWVNGADITRRRRGMWIIDFEEDMPLSEAALYEAPFEHVLEHVKPVRETVRAAKDRELWWIHTRPVPGMRRAIQPLERFIVTPTVAKYRLFVWLAGNVLPDHQLVVVARVDDYFFGVLHSRAHEVWSLRMGTWLGKGNDPRYTPTTTFETFPFPCPTEAQREAIGEAAKRLNELREGSLNPPDATPDQLKKLTLTNLYNARPTWLANAHEALDRVVWVAYGWPEAPAETDDETILSRLLALNLERARS